MNREQKKLVQENLQEWILASLEYTPSEEVIKADIQTLRNHIYQCQNLHIPKGTIREKLFHLKRNGLLLLERPLKGSPLWYRPLPTEPPQQRKEGEAEAKEQRSQEPEGAEYHWILSEAKVEAPPISNDKDLSGCTVNLTMILSPLHSQNQVLLTGPIQRYVEGCGFRVHQVGVKHAYSDNQ